MHQCTHAYARMHMYPCICTHDPVHMPSSSLLARWVTIAQTRPALVCMHPMLMHACICTNAPIHMHQCTCICTHAYTSMHVHPCMCTPAYAFTVIADTLGDRRSDALCPGAHAHAYARTRMCHMHSCICTHAYAPMHVHAPIHPCVCTRTYAPMHVKTYTYAYAFLILAGTLGDRRSDTPRPGARAPKYMHTCICTHTYAPIHPCICTHAYAPMLMHPCSLAYAFLICT